MKKKYKVILTTSYTYEIEARDGDEALYLATVAKTQDEHLDKTDAKEETAFVEEI